MKYKKKSTWSTALALIPVFLLAGCAPASGSVSGADNAAVSESDEISSSSDETSNSGILPDLTAWLNENTNIPVYLPYAWQPVMPSATQNYYYQMLGDENSYSVDVYETDVPVKFNDENDLLEKNGPVSEAGFVGSIKGEKVTDDTPGLSIEIPADAESLELIPGVPAYYPENQNAVWQVNGWGFEWIRGTDAMTNPTIEALVNAWQDADIQVAQTGKVKIVEGNNRFTFYYYWEKDGYQYGFVTYNMDFNDTIKILNSITGSREEVYSSDTAELSEDKSKDTDSSNEYALSYPITVENSIGLTLKLHGKKLSEEYHQYGIRTIEVFDGNDLLQTLQTQEAISAVWDAEGMMDSYGGYTEAYTQDGGLTTIDMNFDGSEDIGLMGWITAGANIPYYYWLWDETQGQYKYSFYLCNPVVDEENQQLVSKTRLSAAEYDTDYYQYDEDGQLQNVKRVVEIYGGPTVITETYELINGELQKVE